MTKEQALRDAWAAFVEAAKVAETAGYVVTLPATINAGVGISTTAKVVDEAPPEPVTETVEEGLDIPTFGRKSSKKKDVSGDD